MSQLKRSKLLDRETVEARQARRLERARKAFLREFGSPGYTGAGDTERWREQGKIFTVTYQGATHIPRFQFDKRGFPLPAIAGVIKALGAKTSEWGLGMWFTAANGWLGGQRPVDLLKDDPERVVRVAEQEAAGLVF
ncbi:MAG: hypothetical protein JF614_09250 [Acidobacteria bacterium]|nr:hypothetical protein [Acidobacteriota bacterium]